MKKMLLFFLIFCTFSAVAQDGSNFKEIKLEECSKTINENGTYTYDINGHKMIGPRGTFEIVHINCDRRFLNVFCLGKYNDLLVLTSKFTNGLWEQYGGYQVVIPGLEIQKTVKKIEFPDINTVYIAYENLEAKRKSYVIRLSSKGHSIYEYLNDAFIHDEGFHKTLIFEGRPKF